MRLFTTQDETLTLGVQLGSGGQGTVYAVEGQPDLVAKRYHHAPAPQHVARLQTLVALGNESLTKIAAWPAALLYEQPHGAVAGFLMPRVDRAAEVHTLHSPKSRLQKFPDATWAFLLHTAANIARAVATLHAAGFVIGDVNPKNILVTRQATVALLDCDSFQFAADGVRYRCEAGFPEYTPPELHGVAFRDVERTPQHDAFGLAVVIFQLLFLGRHPFAGKFLGEGEMPLQRAIVEGRLAYGADALQRQMQAPPGVLPWEALPVDVAQLFERSFLTAQRAAPVEWIAALDALAQALTTCAQHNGHRYAAALAACPWCEIERQARVRLFNVTRKVEVGQSAFRLDEVWREIEQIEAPTLLDALPVPERQPVAAAARVADTKRNGFFLALLMVAATGFATAYVGGFCVFVGVAWIALVAAHFCMKREPQEEEVQAAWPTSKPDVPIQQRIEQTLRNAEARVRTLEQRWEWEIGGRFAAKLTELNSHRRHYESLDATREDRVRQIEVGARQEHLRRHLAQFEIQNSEISGRVLTTYLRVKGIKTAADITQERLDNAHGLTHTHKTILWNWRCYKERGLPADPDTFVHPALRQRVLTETEATRERLEAELRSGAFYLRRLQQEVEAKQLAVRDKLLAAKEALAQAEADYQTAGKRRTLAWPVVVLLVAGLIGGLTNWRHHGIFRDFDSDPPAYVQDISKTNAQQLFAQAESRMKGANYASAIPLLEESVRLNPEYALAHEDLTLSLYEERRFAEALSAAKRLMELQPNFRAHFLLGEIYFAQRNFKDARLTFEKAFERNANFEWHDYSLAQDLYTQSLVRLKEEKPMLETLEAKAVRAEINSIERLQLGLLYLHTNKPAQAKLQANTLEKEGTTAAAEFLRVRIEGMRKAR